MRVASHLTGLFVARDKLREVLASDTSSPPPAVTFFRALSCVSWAILLFFSPLRADDCTQRFRASAFYRLPDVPQLSGIAAMDRNGDSTVCAVVSDKVPAVYVVTIPVPAHTVKKTEGLLSARRFRDIPDAVDLEDLVFDKKRAVLWACAEAHSGGTSVLYRVPLDLSAPVTNRTIDSVQNRENNGAEGIALVPAHGKDELWIAKERFVPPKSTPPVFRYRIDNNGSVGPCVGRFALGLLFHRSQSGMSYDPVSRHVWIISRELRILYAVKPEAQRVLKPDSLSCTYTWDDLLNNRNNAGMAEGISFNDRGDLFVAYDTGEKVVGLDPKALTNESRIVVLRR